jgi:anaerobic sulfite reductase subunit B
MSLRAGEEVLASRRAQAALGWQADPLMPSLFRVERRRQETKDTVTLDLAPLYSPLPRFSCGQFNMVGVVGIGEVPISISSSPDEKGYLSHTIRVVGNVTAALAASRPGSLVTLRGPFGTSWGVENDSGPVDFSGRHVMVLAGGIGLAPLRGAIEVLLGRDDVVYLTILVGARSPDQILYASQLPRWRARGADVRVTVDSADSAWKGSVGTVLDLLDHVPIRAQRVAALVCGPEIMIRLCARRLVELGVAPDQVLVSLERSMSCGSGLCGHCQFGPYLLCRDGPVLPYDDRVAELLSVREI